MTAVPKLHSSFPDICCRVISQTFPGQGFWCLVSLRRMSHVMNAGPHDVSHIDNHLDSSFRIIGSKQHASI